MSRDSVLRSGSALLRQLDSLESLRNKSPLGRRLEERWREEIERIVALSCGVEASLTLKDTVLVARQQAECDLHLTSMQCAVSGVRVRFVLPKGWTLDRRSKEPSQSGARGVSQSFTLQVGEGALPTLPGEITQYASLERRQEVRARIDYLLDGFPVSMGRSPAFDIAPPQWLAVTPDVAGFLPGRSGRNLTFSWKLTNFLPQGVQGFVTAEVPAGWKPAQARFDIRKEDDTAAGQLIVQPPPGVKPGEYVLRFKEGEASVSVPVNVFDVKVAERIRLGIITSYDNTLEAASDELHVPYDLISDNDIEHADLSRFTSIVIDIRAYLVREALKKFNSRLLDYVRNGGNLIVMYQRNQEWKPEYAPFPFEITRKRVTVEEAPVALLVPDHPLLSTPNRIGDRDWNGWKQERGIYFPGMVAEQYTRLLSTSDPDEEPLTTGYLVAQVEKGSYIYSSFVWYRELKEKNPGAFRCFANMISYSFTRK
jgi:hypothetical protein